MARSRKLDLAAAVHGAAQKQTSEPTPEKLRNQPRSYRPASREGKKGVLIHVSHAMSKQLRQLALDEDTTVQALGHEALENLLTQRGRRT